MQTNILDWLEATSARCPDAPAVGDDQTDCTWAQLADTARRAGSFLASRTMPRRPVAFYLEKSVSAFAAMLGTVYAGCCYSVLDTRQPASRTLQVLDTLTPAFLVTDEAHAAAAAALGYSGQIIRLDDLLAAPADAALLAARRSRKAITMEDIEEASMKVMAGPEKKSRVVTPEEKKLTAYHEAGHAVAGFYCKHHPRVHEITIIPRGQAGGYTMYLPEKDRSYVTKGEMFEDIVSSLGGRVAEQLILEDISTGASNDLQQATNIARQMITKYGFSERLGPVVYGTSQEETFLGRDLGQGKGYSETTAAEIDGEMRDIIDEAYENCRRTLTEHIDQLHALAKALMEREKLNEQQFNTIMAGGTLPPLEDPDAKQPEQTVQPAQPVETAEKAETAEHAEQAETAEQPTGQQPEQDPAPEQDAPEAND